MDEFMQRIRHAIWTCESFNFPVEHAIKYINSGLLGYQTNKDGKEKIDKYTGKPILKTISRSSFFRYKKDLEGMPQIYEDLKYAADQGYAKMLVGLQEQIDTLVRMSAENLFAGDLTPLERQSIIDSMITKVLPGKTTVASMIKKLTDSKKIIPKEENKSAKSESS